MKIVTFSHYKDVDEKEIKDSVAVVIDLLRATSVMIWAISNGAEKIIPVESIEEARLFKSVEETFILGGERGGLKIEGFDLDNSPLSYKKEVVCGRKIIMTTTNGTRALKRAVMAKRIFLGSFINAQKTAEYILKEALKKDIQKITIVCAGTEEKFTLEDILCAGYFVDMFKNGLGDVEIDDLSLASFELYKKFENDPHKILKYSYHYNRLKQLGFEKDLEFCLRKDFVDCICEYKNLVVEKVFVDV
ncbi:2-phosphosulfolactate phosphatase [Caldicellulosiruptor obsidiansis OB47]|uniref:Probable 2-phosphosulfolactate phosphatase n=1 Tax=Caldicellulosiruptor obsidiansis (strain ATCC BAA-2073 / JCM 16842 / OB47) TaxID=608506 RepID=D9THY7_CALOO|nr:2-phosphosulfolactate phosphatase family protein [Caldicellulosiruptor obsidiansis]ADL41619.1 2-phosphosulfolactate phosphatase [Caldicellulosiruptor obsidiansis OB47]